MLPLAFRTQVAFAALTALMLTTAPVRVLGQAWTQPSAINYVLVGGDGRFYVNLSENANNCTNGSWYVIKDDHRAYEIITATLLMADAAKRKVKVFAGGCDVYGHNLLGHVGVERP